MRSACLVFGTRCTKLRRMCRIKNATLFFEMLRAVFLCIAFLVLHCCQFRMNCARNDNKYPTSYTQFRTVKEERSGETKTDRWGYYNLVKIYWRASEMKYRVKEEDSVKWWQNRTMTSNVFLRWLKKLQFLVLQIVHEMYQEPSMKLTFSCWTEQILPSGPKRPFETHNLE